MFYQWNSWRDVITVTEQNTEDAGHKVEGELRGEQREEPRRRVEAGADLVLLKVVVQVTVVVVQQPGQLVHLNLRRQREESSIKHTHTQRTSCVAARVNRCQIFQRSKEPQREK